MEFIRKNRYWLLLGLILLTGIFFRVSYLGSENLWRDEAFSVNAASGSIERLVSTIQNDSHPPVHLSLLYFWIKLFGNSELSVRLLSALFGIFTILSTYKIAQILFKNRSQILFAVFLISLNPILIDQSREARQYSIFVFFFSITFLFLLRSIKNTNKKDIVLFAISVVTMIYTQYIGFIILGVFIMLLLSRKDYPILKLSIPLILVAGAPLLILLYYQLQIVGGTTGWLIFDPIIDLVFDSFWILSGKGFAENIWILLLQHLLIGLGLYSLYVTVLRYKDLKIEKIFFDFNVGAKVFIWLISFVFPLFFIRYISFIAIPVHNLISRSTDFMSKSVRKFYIILYILTLPILSVYNLTQHKYPDYKSATSFVGSEQIYHISPESFHTFSYYNIDSKILGNKDNYKYFQGTSGLNHSNFIEIPTTNTFFTVELGLSQDSNTYNKLLLEKLGYGTVGRRVFRGIIVEQWVKIR